MSQKKTLLKYTKYVMWGTVALIPFFVHHRTASDGIPDRGYRGAGIRACQCLCGAFPHQPAGTVGHSVLEDGGKCVRQL